ncbi:hypothetical protein M8J77_024023 [Diaphorina citri]|nr:hypothetical protein M8J77_024023 [Diaphorina citri]
MRRGGGSRRKSKDQSEMEKDEKKRKKKKKKRRKKRRKKKKRRIREDSQREREGRGGSYLKWGCSTGHREGGDENSRYYSTKEIDSEIWTGGVNTVRGIIMRTIYINVQ